MASTSKLPISGAAQGAPKFISSWKFQKIFQELGEKGRKSLKKLKFKKGVKILNDNSGLIKDVTTNVCALLEGVPVAGACVFLITFIVKTAADFIENKSKKKNLEKHAKLLKVCLEIIRKAGEDNEDLNICLTMLSEEAFEIETRCRFRIRKQGILKGFFSAQPEAKWLDELVAKFKDMYEQLSLYCGTVMLEHTVAIKKQNTVILEHLTPVRQAPLGNSSLKIPKKAEYLKFVSTPEIRVLCVCGMEGVGKTALLKALYDEFPNEDKPAKAFVEVGRDPTNVMEIQTKILSQLKPKKENFVDTDFIDTEQGRNGLRDCIKGFKAGGKSLCLCIDNVWKANVLRELLPEDLHLHLPRWSCLMLSTREKLVADEFRNICCSNNPNASYKLFRPEFMGSEEAEDLFVRCADIEDKEKERDLINAIVPVCDGLPLALKTYGTCFKSPQVQNVKRRILTAKADGDDEVRRRLEPY